MTFFIILIIAINILAVGTIIYNYFDFKKGNNHKITGFIAKIFVPFLSILGLYIIAVIYNDDPNITVFDWLRLGKYTFATFGFDIEKSILIGLYNDELIYRIAWWISFPYAVLTVYYTVISQFTNSINNYIGIRLALRKNCDIIIGLDELESYKAINRNLIVWLEKDASKEDERLLTSNNLYFIKKSFTCAALKSLRFKMNGKVNYHFISFQSEQKNLALTSEFKKFLDLDIKRNASKVYKTKSFYIHAEIGIDNIVTIQNKILHDKKEFSPFINFFNRYELVSLKFNEEHPISKYIGTLVDQSIGAISNDGNVGEEITIDFIDSRTNNIGHITVNNPYSKAINVIYLGYGRVSREIHRGSLMNNQLISYDEKTKKLSNHLINYFAFDKNAFSSENKNNLYYQNRFDHEANKFDSDDYYDAPEALSNFYPIPVDINSNEFYDDIIKIAKMKDSYTSIVVSLADDLDNIDYSLKIVQLFKQLGVNNYQIFVRVKERNKETIELLDDNHLTFFGWKNSVLNHDVIVNDDLLNLAKMSNKKYSEKNKTLLDLDWYKLSPIKQKSNIYASLNIRVKLNLIGYDYELTDTIIDNSNLLNELDLKLKAEKAKYEDYLFFKSDTKPVAAQVLSYQEHSRWNSFYISNGYVPFPKNEICVIEFDKKDDDGNIVLDENGNVVKDYAMYKDDDNLRMHACLTTYEGLDAYHRDCAKVLSNHPILLSRCLKMENKELDILTAEEKINKVLNKEHTYQFDYNIIESFEKIFKNSKYKLKKLNK